MKRRTAGAAGIEGKRGRPIKRSPKISDSFLGGSVVYLKLLALWLIVLLSDYFLEFRFEYLWPFWLFMRSVYDSFKYQGLAFSVFFICIAITSDMICYLFIPVHWLFFAASTYVWVQYVWHTEKGVCMPTLALWLVFVYVEAAIRLKEFKAHVDLRNLPFHLDLCRPFAAHCIGYPVVTLGFGFKSYVGYRIRQRKQKEVQKTNEYYFDFLREALPPGPIRQEAFNPHPSPKTCSEDRSSDSTVMLTPSSSNGVSMICNGGTPDRKVNGDLPDLTRLANGGSGVKSQKLSNGLSYGDLEYLEKTSNDVNGMSNGVDDGSKSRPSKSVFASGGRSENNKKKELPKQLTKDEAVVKLEQDLKRLKTDLQQSRNKENDLRDQIVSFMSAERHLKSEISNLQVEKSVLESRVSGLLSTRAGEKATLSTLEKKLAEERKQKTDFQIKLEMERKTKKEAVNAERTVRENQTRGEVLKLEAEIKTLRSELQVSRERCQSAEQEAYALRKYKETHGDPEVLVTALKNMQEKNKQIENSLSAETKLKMDLFSALSDAKRELSIKQQLLGKKDREIGELKAKIAEVLAVMPTSVAASVNSTSSTVPTGITSFAPTTLATLDLPPATDLSFTGKLSSLGLDFDDNSDNNLFNSHSFSASGSSSLYSAQTNGKVNDV